MQIRQSTLDMSTELRLPGKVALAMVCFNLDERWRPWCFESNKLVVFDDDDDESICGLAGDSVAAVLR